MYQERRFRTYERAMIEIARLNAEIIALQVRLDRDALEEPPTFPDFGVHLDRQTSHFIAAMIGAYPKAVSRYDLDRIIPKRDHAADRDLKVFDVMAVKARAGLGAGMIDTERAFGWRATKALMQRVRDIRAREKASEKRYRNIRTVTPISRRRDERRRFG